MTSAHVHTAVIRTSMRFRVRTSLNGRLIETYLCTLMYIRVWIEATKSNGIANPLNWHRTCPVVQRPFRIVSSDSGMSRRAVKRSVTARLHRNMLVRVRMPRCWTITTTTMTLPTIATSMMTESVTARNAVVATPQ